MRLFFISCLLILSFSIAQAQKDSRPNFIIILADDLGYGDVGFTGSTQIRTPNIDALAASGVTFENGYVSSAVCSPSRAGLLTGRNQVTFGYDNNLTVPKHNPMAGGLPVELKTIAQRLKNEGYKTGIVGKWHLGSEDVFHPLNRGFDEFWGYLGGGHDYFSTEGGKGYEAPIICNYKQPQPLTYITDDKGDECVDFIKRHKLEPFFLYASFNAPHTPMQGTKEDLELYMHVENKSRRAYCAMVHRLDVNVGKILEELERQKLRDNTVVVFLSDNGGPPNQNSSINAPFRGSKGILLEGGVHVPFVMSYPAKLKKRTTFEPMVSSLDLTPTFVALAGGTIDEKDQLSGVNIMPYLTGESKAKPHENLMWRFTISAAMREDNWKLVRIPDRMPMLYDLSKDVAEVNNVALKYPDRVEAMMKKLGTWDVEQPHPLFLEGARWKMVQLKLYDQDYILEQPEESKGK